MKDLKNYRISIYVMETDFAGVTDALESVADNLQVFFKNELVFPDGDVKYVITASEIELPATPEEFIEGVAKEAFALLAPNGPSGKEPA